MSLKLADQPKLDSVRTKGRFLGQVAVVTGGGGGIGSAIVQRFFNDGARVALLDLRESSATAKIKEMVGEDPSLAEHVKFFPVDVSSRDACFNVVSQVVAEFGKVNHLVNSVAYFGSQSLEATEEDWDRTMSFMVQAVAHHIKSYSTTQNCSVVNISSISAHQTQPNRWTYAASKGAINILTKDMALDLAPFKIRKLNTVNKYQAAGEGGREKWEPVWGRFHISNRLGDISEVAAAVTFLASNDAAFINATDLKVDGGYGAMSAEGFGDLSSFAGTGEK